MNAEIEYKGVKKQLILPENTVFVNFRAHSKRFTCNILNIEVKEIEEMLGCSAVMIAAMDYPIRMEIEAYVDKSGILSNGMKTFSGLKMVDILSEEYRFLVTV